MSLESLETAVDILWLIGGTILVLVMQPGFAMLEVGAVNVLNVRANTESILLKNLLDVSLGAICWWCAGNGISVGDASSSNGWIGRTDYGLVNQDDEGHEFALWLFRWAFAATSATIVSGALAERCTQWTYVVFSIFMTAFIYPMVSCWAWNGHGWASPMRSGGPRFFGCGVIDFAGSGVVHLTGGTAAFIGAWRLGPRNAFVAQTLRTPMYGPIFDTCGTLVLWLGWFGFNAVSTLSIVNYGPVATRTMVTTAIAGATGALSAGLLMAFLKARVKILECLDNSQHPTTEAMGDRGFGGPKTKDDRPTKWLAPLELRLAFANRGVLSGLVAVTASCATVEPYAAFIIGLGSAPIYLICAGLLRRNLIDDVVDASPIHAAGGIYGLICAGLFSTPKYLKQVYGMSNDQAQECAGVFHGGSGASLASGVVFGLIVMIWSAATAGSLFSIMYHFDMLRVNQALEDVGLDDSQHENHQLVEEESGATAVAAKAQYHSTYPNVSQGPPKFVPEVVAAGHFEPDELGL